MREIIYINKLDFITIIKKLISIFVLLGARFSLKNIREALPPLPLPPKLPLIAVALHNYII